MWRPSKLAEERAVRRRSAVYPTIDVSGFLAVMVALLFLLMPWTVVDRKGGSVELAPALHSVYSAGAAREDALIVAISRDGSFYFRDMKIAPEQLEAQIRSGVQDGAWAKVYLSVDRNAKYANVRLALEQIQRAGVERIFFITE